MLHSVCSLFAPPDIEVEFLVERYVNVKVPEQLSKEIDRLVEKKLLGYRSRAEFIAEAIREKLAAVKRFEKP
jgi:metal-responsive CopG/Arc/MetJ family transcriptional regulator